MNEYQIELTTIANREKGHAERTSGRGISHRARRKSSSKSRETATDVIGGAASRTSGSCSSNLPMGAVVETHGVVDSNGFHASCVGPLPEALADTLRPHCTNMQLTVKAVTGDWDKAYIALANDPL